MNIKFFKNAILKLLQPITMDARVFFLHVPKCGGTSLRHALIKKSLMSFHSLNAIASLNAAKIALGLEDELSDGYRSVLKFRESILLYEMAKDTRLVTGHYGFSELAFKNYAERYAFVILLRDPVERFISHLFYLGIEDNLMSFLESQRARYWGNQYVRMLIDPGLNLKPDTPDAVKLACSNLERFRLVGCLEHMDGFMASIQSELGLRLSMPHRNRGKARPAAKRKRITDEVAIRIREVCAPDTVVYEHALNLIQARKKE
jgi:hypothetical protein